MNASWREKLTSFGLVQKDGSFVYPAVSSASDVLCTLASDTIFQVSGDDAEKFLQDQFSNDIGALETPGSQLTTWSSPKGRVIAVMRVVRVDDGYLIKLPTLLAEPVLKRLRMYALLFKVVIDGKLRKPERPLLLESRDDLVAIGISGQSAEAAMANAGYAVGQQPDDTTEVSGDAWITRVRGEIPRFEIIGSAEKLAELWATCSEGCSMADESAWRLQNIDAGLPSVGEQTTEAFVLQMLNLQHINGVSFTKGCFPGQEVVARMQYLGKLKRQMFRLQYSGDHVPLAGDEIYKAGGGSAAGKVVDAVNTGDGTSRLLAVIAIDATNEPLFFDKEEQQALTLLEFPYDTPAPE